ncbi:hypothetical protein Bpfe_029712 [Biomphalaria pfeifferi]|uniref:Uncharacterized protein n=1 Tax=Biomphalaria pfeifferi TaxID=112525 RepID=A0AAD8AR23_BIOPF|nr:hypothetical protein Bpfe_029712 [Biomphalaria pfeifferi]
MNGLKWDPCLVGERFTPSFRKSRFGTVPHVRCYGEGNRCSLFLNSTKSFSPILNAKRTCSPDLNPTRTFSPILNPRKFYSPTPDFITDCSPRKSCSPIKNFYVSGRHGGSLQNGNIAQDEDNLTEMEIRVPKEHERHILEHMRCSCSACMKFACKWRLDVKKAIWTQFKKRIVSDDNPAREIFAKRFQQSPKKVANCSPMSFSPRPCLRISSPQTTHQCRNSPLVDHLCTPKLYQRECGKFYTRLDSPKNKTYSQPFRCKDGYNAVAMDGTIKDSELRNKQDYIFCPMKKKNGDEAESKQYAANHISQRHHKTSPSDEFQVDRGEKICPSQQKNDPLEDFTSSFFPRKNECCMDKKHETEPQTEKIQYPQRPQCCKDNHDAKCKETVSKSNCFDRSLMHREKDVPEVVNKSENGLDSADVHDLTLRYSHSIQNLIGKCYKHDPSTSCSHLSRIMDPTFSSTFPPLFRNDREFSETMVFRANCLKSTFPDKIPSSFGHFGCCESLSSPNRQQKPFALSGVNPVKSCLGDDFLLRPSKGEERNCAENDECSKYLSKYCGDCNAVTDFKTDQSLESRLKRILSLTASNKHKPLYMSEKTDISSDLMEISVQKYPLDGKTSYEAERLPSLYEHSISSCLPHIHEEDCRCLTEKHIRNQQLKSSGTTDKTLKDCQHSAFKEIPCKNICNGRIVEISPPSRNRRDNRKMFECCQDSNFFSGLPERLGSILQENRVGTTEYCSERKTPLSSNFQQRFEKEEDKTKDIKDKTLFHCFDFPKPECVQKPTDICTKITSCTSESSGAGRQRKQSPIHPLDQQSPKKNKKKSPVSFSSDKQQTKDCKQGSSDSFHTAKLTLSKGGNGERHSRISNAKLEGQANDATLQDISDTLICESSGIGDEMKLPTPASEKPPLKSNLDNYPPKTNSDNYRSILKTEKSAMANNKDNKRDVKRKHRDSFLTNKTNESCKNTFEFREISFRNDDILLPERSLFRNDDILLPERSSYRNSATSFEISPPVRLPIRKLHQNNKVQEVYVSHKPRSTSLHERKLNSISETSSETEIDSSRYKAAEPLPRRLKTSLAPSERVLREPMARTESEWLKKHTSLMTDCCKEQQDNSKERVQRLSQKTRDLKRSISDLSLDLDKMEKQLDKVKTLQRGYLHRANRAVHLLKQKRRRHSTSPRIRVPEIAPHRQNCTRRCRDSVALGASSDETASYLSKVTHKLRGLVSRTRICKKKRELEELYSYFVNQEDRKRSRPERKSQKESRICSNHNSKNNLRDGESERNSALKRKKLASFEKDLLEMENAKDYVSKSMSRQSSGKWVYDLSKSIAEAWFQEHGDKKKIHETSYSGDESEESDKQRDHGGRKSHHYVHHSLDTQASSRLRSKEHSSHKRPSCDEPFDSDRKLDKNNRNKSIITDEGVRKRTSGISANKRLTLTGKSRSGKKESVLDTTMNKTYTISDAPA